MKNGLLTLGFALLALTGQAQDTIPLYSDALTAQQARLAAANRAAIGVDLFPVYWYLASGGNENVPDSYARPVSVTVYLPKQRSANQLSSATRAFYVNVGYLGYGGMLRRNIYQRGNSLHVRAGIELTKNGFIWGYGGVVSGWSGQGSFSFNGSYFGPYRQDIGRRGGVALGLEGHGGLSFPLTNRLSLRGQFRVSAGVRTANAENLPPPRLSGIELATRTESPLILGLNPQVNVVFRL